MSLVPLGCHTSGAPLHADNPPGHWYVVGADETLDGIARRQRVPPEDILELNGMNSAAEVRPGRLLFVLGPVAAPNEDAPAPPPELSASPGGRPALRWPLRRVVVGSPFGARWGKPHEGIDLPAPIGTPVFAAADGQVIYAGSGVRGYGLLVVLRHPNDLLTVYAHNSLLLVTEGQPVRAGDLIARVGQSGHATGPHLHFEVRIGQIPRDPMPYLPPGGSS